MNAIRTFIIGLIVLFAYTGTSIAAEEAKAAADQAKAPADQAQAPADQAKAPAEAKAPADQAQAPAASGNADDKNAGGPLVDAVKAEIKNKSKATGTLDVFDNKTQKVRTLDVIGLKETAKDTVTGDFRDTKTGDVVTVEVKVADGKVGDFNILKAEPPKAAQQAKKDYTDKELQDFMKDYIDTQAAGTGVFQLFDEKTKKMRQLQFVKLQEKVRRYGIIGISTAEFKEKDTGNTILADINVENKKEGLEVTAVRIKNEVKNGGGSPSAMTTPEPGAAPKSGPSSVAAPVAAPVAAASK
jgi:hypothetical protein